MFQDSIETPGILQEPTVNLQTWSRAGDIEVKCRGPRTKMQKNDLGLETRCEMHRKDSIAEAPGAIPNT